MEKVTDADFVMVALDGEGKPEAGAGGIADGRTLARISAAPMRLRRSAAARLR